MSQLVVMQPVFEQYDENTNSIHDASLQVDRRGFREVTRYDRNLLKGQFVHHTLGNDLGIEDEIVAVLHEAHRLQIFA